MLESIFILTIAMAFVLFVLSILDENLMFSSTSLLMWIIVMAGQLYIEVPGDTTYSEIPFFSISLGFILILIIWTIVLWADFDYWRRNERPWE